MTTQAVQYPAPTERGGPATVVRNGTTGTVGDAELSAIVGAGNAVRFNASFDIVLPGPTGTLHLHFRAGETHVLVPAIKAALIAASAPMTVF